MFGIRKNRVIERKDVTDRQAGEEPSYVADVLGLGTVASAPGQAVAPAAMVGAKLTSHEEAVVNLLSEMHAYGSWPVDGDDENTDA